MRNLVGLTSALLIGTAAFAHAEEQKAPLWNQIYLGISGGVVDADTMIVDLDDSVFDEEGAIADLSSIAGLYGVQAGVTRQFGSAVVGIEIDFNGSNYDEKIRFDDFANDTTPDQFASASLSWLTTLRAKAGVAFGSAFAYVTGGIAFADIEFCATDDGDGCEGTDSQEVGGSEVLTGFAVGSGIEYRLTKAISVKTEYLYVDLGRKTLTNGDAGAGADSISLDLNLHILRAGLNYRFGYDASTSSALLIGSDEDGQMAQTDWSGVYLGFSGGVIGPDTTIVDLDDSVFDDEGVLADLSDISALYGIQAGIRRQFGNAVIGLEADFSGTNYDETLRFDDFANDTTPDHFASASMNWLSTIRAKAGLAYGNTLIYVTGGVALAEVEFCATDDGDGCQGTSSEEVSGNEVFAGFAVGSGVEIRLTDSLSVKTEYLYVDLERKVFVVPQVGNDDERISVDVNMHIFRAGLNYSFGHSGGGLTASVKDEPQTSANWGGIYVGINGGISGTNARIVDLDDAPFDEEGGSADLSDIAGVYGVQAGYAWQLGNFVFGFEADLNGSSYDEGYNFDDANNGDNFASAEMNWLSTVRAKAGLAYGNALVYVTGGLAFADIDFCATDDSNGCRGVNGQEISGSEVFSGFAAGTGVEFKLTDALSIKTEYLFVGLNKDEITNDDPGTGADSISIDADHHLFRFGLNYSFGNVVTAGQSLK